MNKKLLLYKAILLLSFGAITCFVNAQYLRPFSNLATTGSQSWPMGMVTDAAGNLYVSNYSTGSISKITRAGVVSGFATVGGHLEKMVMDNAGNIYAVSSTGDFGSTVNIVTPAGASSILANIPGGGGSNTGYIGIAINKSTGNIYTTDNTGNTVSQITPLGYRTSFVVGAKPMGIALDAAGNIYTANWGSNTVSKLSPTGALLATYPVGPNPWGIVINPTSGNIYVSNAGPYDAGASPSPNGTVSKITSTGIVTTTWATVQNAAAEMAIDASGNVYVVNTYSGTVSEITPAGAVTHVNLPVVSPIVQNELYPATILISSGHAYVSVQGTDMIAVTDLTILPVTLSSFTAVAQQSGASLRWTTASEQHNNHFDIERSTNGINWSAISTVTSKAADGNSNLPLSYTYNDIKPVPGTN